MSNRSPENSTNVRLYMQASAAPATLGLMLWVAFVGLMQSIGAIATLAGDVKWLELFACAVALLAYAVDAELRRALIARPAVVLALGVVATAASRTHPAAELAFSPAAAVCLAVLVRRAV